jgi:hypothetical protein
VRAEYCEEIFKIGRAVVTRVCERKNYNSRERGCVCKRKEKKIERVNERGGGKRDRERDKIGTPVKSAFLDLLTLIIFVG